MFRASPWVTYDPATTEFRHTPPNLDNSMADHDANEDVDMDAPQISTLREEETPPPQQAASHSSRIRVKLVVKENKNTSSPPASTPRKQPASDDEEDEDEDEDEEDQLIDDDDVEPPSSSAPRQLEVAPNKRKASSKRKPRKTEKRIAEDERKLREKLLQAEQLSHTSSASMMSTIPVEPSPLKATPKKRTPRKPPVVPRSRPKAVAKSKPVLILAAEDPGVLSEGYTGTAASSPITAHYSPEPDHPDASVASGPSAEDTNLDFVPLPVYPLPSKPFPVQPPPKIGTGFAPLIPLDKSGSKVRKWRVAHREIRGIAGGRWFARTWVGDKQSDLAVNAADNERLALSGSVILPKLPGVSISAPPTKSRPRGVKALASTSAGPSSRAGSLIPDSHSARPPTKMRTIIATPRSEGNDSDMGA